MKKLLFLAAFVLSTFTSQADHVLGGEITYEYIGDSTGTPFHYKVKMTLHRIFGVGAPPLFSSYSVNVSSNCYSTQSVMVTRITPPTALAAGDGGFLMQGGMNCIDTTTPGLIRISMHKYEGTVILPGTCSDFRFYYDVCCRTGVITNLNDPASSPLHFTAFLNNTQGPNTSPAFIDDPLIYACVSQNVFLSHSVIEPDGDSIFFEFSAPRTGMNSFAPYDSGYSVNNPVTSTGMSLKNGVMNFRPSQVENDVIAVTITEYRLPPWGMLIPVSKITREVILNIVASCQQDTIHWPVNSLGIDTTADISCNDSIIKLQLAEEVLVDSLEFRVISLSDNMLRPIISIEPKNTYGGIYSKEIWLHMYQPFTYNDTLLLYNKSDLQTSCGAFYSKDTVRLLVNSCNTFFDLPEGKAEKGIEIYPNPVTDILTLSVPSANKPDRVVIYDIAGSLVYQKDLTGERDAELQIRCDFLKPGVYSVFISSGEKTTAYKLMKI